MVKYPHLYIFTLTTAIILGSPQSSKAQGCSQCRDNVSASSPKMQEGFRKGIAVLGIAAGGVFLGMLQVARSHRGKEPED